MKQTGLGVERFDGVLHLIKPTNLLITKDRLEFVEIGSTKVNA